MPEAFDHPRSANRVHVPDLERRAYNQMPKSGYKELKLFRYESTDLYQWFGVPSRLGAVFQDPCDEPFVIEPSEKATAWNSIETLDHHRPVVLRSTSVPWGPSDGTYSYHLAQRGTGSRPGVWVMGGKGGGSFFSPDKPNGEIEIGLGDNFDSWADLPQ